MYTSNMPKRLSKPPRDLNLLAKSLVDKATTEDLLDKAIEDGKNPAAVYLGRLGGLKGGKARASRLSSERRHQIAKMAAKTRWGNRKT
jgi:hypothetical protein